MLCIIENGGLKLMSLFYIVAQKNISNVSIDILPFSIFSIVKSMQHFPIPSETQYA